MNHKKKKKEKEKKAKFYIQLNGFNKRKMFIV